MVGVDEILLIEWRVFWNRIHRKYTGIITAALGAASAAVSALMTTISINSKLEKKTFLLENLMKFKMGWENTMKKRRNERRIQLKFN